MNAINLLNSLQINTSSLIKNEVLTKQNSRDDTDSKDDAIQMLKFTGAIVQLVDEKKKLEEVLLFGPDIS